VYDNAVATNLYCIAQEAVNNALRHGAPARITIRLDAGPRLGRLTVADDGRGLGAGAEESEGMGLRIMRYRATMVGGNLELAPATRDGRPGTVVACTFENREPREATGES
jgi:two-component system CheB/CheR fusion protein